MFKSVSEGIYKYDPIKFIYGRKPANPKKTTEKKEGLVTFTLYTGKRFKNGR